MLGKVTRLSKQSAVYGLGTFLNQGIAFFLIPLYTRFLTPEEYGINGSVTAVMGVRKFSPSLFGKAATAVYVITCVVLMWFNYLGRPSVLVKVGIWTSFGITLLSGFHYVAHATRIINAPRPPTSS